MSIKPFQWSCPFCNHHQMVSEHTHQSAFSKLYIGKSKDGDVGLQYTAVRCTNPNCNDVTLVVSFQTSEYDIRNSQHVGAEVLGQWRLKPESWSVVQPDYIPAPLREDYYEACLIRDKSPKASATLARRCLQGMIRDFCGISSNRLIDEIKELKKLVEEGSAPKGVEAETIDAIDAIRDVGNIGAHMEKDINLIIEVDPGEAQALIELVEMLFEEWYVARNKRGMRLASVKAIAAEKKLAIETGRAEIAQNKLLTISEGTLPLPKAASD